MTNITTTSFNDGVVASSATMNANFGSCEAVLNGGLDTGNFAANAAIDPAKISPGTDGQVLARVTTNTWKGGVFQIADAFVPSSSSFVFTSISSAFAVLYLVISCRTTSISTTSTLQMKLNGSTSSDYYGSWLDNGAGKVYQQNLNMNIGYCSGAGSGGGTTRGLCTVFIPNYADSTNYTTVFSDYSAPSLLGTADGGSSRWTWATQAAISSLEVFVSGTEFASGSRVSLYGMG